MQSSSKTLRFEISSQTEAELAIIQAGNLLLEEYGHGYGWSEVVVTRAPYPASRQQEAYLAIMTKFLSRWVHWHGLALSPREWEDLLVAAWRKEFPVPGLTGGLAFVGGRARDLGVQACSQVIAIAEELFQTLGLSTREPPDGVVDVTQCGDELADLRVVKRPLGTPSLPEPMASQVPSWCPSEADSFPERSARRGWGKLNVRPPLADPVGQLAATDS